MEIADFQQNVSDLTAAWTDPKANENLESIMLLLSEEMGELARAVRKSRAESAHVDVGHTLSDELGDVLFLLARVALSSNIDLDDAASSVVAKIHTRVGRSD